ncbi:MAG TPA: capsule assembly Wzi family protein [Acidisarcina sp.]
MLAATLAGVAQAQVVSPIKATPSAWTGVDLTQQESTMGSPYIPIDSWIYPAMSRLAALGYVDTAFAGLRPWTRLSVANMLAETSERLSDQANDAAADAEGVAIYHALTAELDPDVQRSADAGHFAQIDQLYTRAFGIGGTPLRDSYHVGSTLVNDYGRPYESGFNNVTGVAGSAVAGRFSLFFRGEYQHAPAATGYPLALAQQLDLIDAIIPYHPHQDTIPAGPIASVNSFRIVEATASMHLLGHEVSFGKSDEWLGPAQGGSFAWSNNAENIYSFRIDRVEPLRIPGLSRLTGPFRYDFLVGSLKGHTNPNAPWVHAEKLNFKPTRNLEFGFERTVIWGGEGHVPITIHTFLRSFFSFSSPTPQVKGSRGDPGARFGSFDMSYRLPYLRNWLTFYSDSEVHDDISPPSAPRRAAYRPGLYLSHMPGMPKLDLRVEAVSTDPTTRRSNGGMFMYFENQQLQGYTNKGQIFGDWIGREGKGGQAWLTYHLSPRESIQLAYRNAKVSKDFIPGGTTQNDFTMQVVKRLRSDLEVNAWVQVEGWKVPLIKSGIQHDVTAAAQLTWYLPKFNR